MNTILLHIHDDDQQDARLQAAVDLARAWEGHIRCLQVLPFEYFVGGDPFGGMYAFTDVLKVLRDQQEDERKRIEARLAAEGASWDWVQLDGNASEALLANSRFADVIVLSQPVTGGKGRNPAPIAADVVLHARVPVLCIPSGLKALDPCGIAMVAWNGSFEAAQGLRLALPLLKLATAVELVEVTEKEQAFPAADAALYLSRHGISANCTTQALGGGTVAEALLKAARALPAGYIVMGAYGHSRLRETVLGGTTRDLMRTSPLPLLLAH